MARDGDQIEETAGPGRLTRGFAERFFAWFRASALGRWLSPNGDSRSLSTKLLALTAVFVMLAEVVIFVPSIANFRANWLTDRLNAANLAALAAEAFPGGEVPDALRRELLSVAGVAAVSVKRVDQRKLVLKEDFEINVAEMYDLRPMTGVAPTFLQGIGVRARLVIDALVVFAHNDQRFIRVIGSPNMAEGQSIDVVLAERALKQAMVRYATNIFLLSLAISALAGGLVYLTLRAFLVRPLTDLTANMLHFSANPEDASRIIEPSARRDEIGTAERELAHMQTELHQVLAQKSRLAALGLAVSKINHDLRNMLANAQLLSDNLTSVPDARVQRFAPKLIASLDRAISFCNDTLKFGRAAEAPPRRDLMLLTPLIEEVGEGLALPRKAVVDLRIDVPEGLRVDADRDQLYRVLSNLMRNAMQAIEAQSPSKAGGIHVSAVREPRRVLIDIHDDGPGLPKAARDHLFQAFQGSTRRGGTGLGLAIAQELATAHGGSLALLDTSAGEGTTFRLIIPDRRITAET